MTRVVCAVCGREVNGRVPADSSSGVLFPYRPLPPVELGQVSHEHEDGTTSWFGHGKWCGGTWVDAEAVK